MVYPLSLDFENFVLHFSETVNPFTICLPIFSLLNFTFYEVIIYMYLNIYNVKKIIELSQWIKKGLLIVGGFSFIIAFILTFDFILP